MTDNAQDFGKGLHWEQLSWSTQKYDLKDAAGQVVARLRFRKGFTAKADAQVDGKLYHLRRGGRLRARVTLREDGAEQDTAVYEGGLTSGGKAVFPDQSRFSWVHDSAFGAAWSFDGEQGRVVRMVSKKKLLRLMGRVEFEEGAHHTQHGMLLTILGWYMITVRAQEEAAAAAAEAQQQNRPPVQTRWAAHGYRGGR